MENIYKPRIDKIIHVGNALSEFRNELLQNRISRIVQSDTDIKEVMGFTGSSNTFEKLLESVDVGEHLSSPKDMGVFTFNPAKIQNIPNVVGKTIPTKAMKFKCVQHASESRQGTFKRAVEGKLRYSKHKYVDLSTETLPGNDLVPFQEMLLVIRIYEPFKHKTGQRLRHPRFSHEFHVLSSQFLTELKDKIYCNCDAGPFYEISENRSLWNETNNGNDTPKSGFFFIHDTFYNDLRHESHHDYSAVVRKWAEKQSMIGELRSERLTDTQRLDNCGRLEQLKINGFDFPARSFDLLKSLCIDELFFYRSYLIENMESRKPCSYECKYAALFQCETSVEHVYQIGRCRVLISAKHRTRTWISRINYAS
ncbi:uncharacterized protein LOC128270495 [Anopheles cruzii]|uniref:uncharacterized protein LOC128270495 n=1 Tax=Anopheles cruzii TaxID=68878 RepID=UPI0022EC9690|nr:uncharacterized protein LOC128270495 [Anopheles cruzii]